MKRCPKCGDMKPLSDFTPDKTKASGYASRCKPCDAARSKDYYQRTNGAKAKARYRADPEKRKAQSAAARKASYAADPEGMRRKWREQWSKRERSPRRREQERARYPGDAARRAMAACPPRRSSGAVLMYR
jgi:hypothetical protein